MQWAGLWQMVLALLPSPLAGVASGSHVQSEAERQLQRELFQQKMSEYARVAATVALRVAQLLLGVAVLFATAAMLYSVLYYLVIPSRLHEQEIFFDYGNHAALTQDASHTSQILTLPTARLNLLDTDHQWTASPLVALPPTPSQVLVPGVKYDVIVELTMPESPVNQEIGMFMIRSTLSSQHSGVLASSARSAIVKSAHAVIQFTRVFAWLVPYALRLSEPAQTLVVSVVNGYEESKTHPLTHVDLELNHPALQIYSAKLTIIAQLSGVRYLMYHWSLSTALLVILNIVFLEALALLVLYAFYQLPPPTSDSGDGDATHHQDESPASGELLDKGALFERHRSGGIPPVHVERKTNKNDPKIKQEPLADDEHTSCRTTSLLADELEWKLRYRDDKKDEPFAESFSAAAQE